MQAHIPVRAVRIACERPEERLEWWRGRREQQELREALSASVSNLWSNLQQRRH